MNSGEIKLRAHHGMCLAFFEGKGYGAGFTARMAQVSERLKQENPMVTVVAEADCICGGCPKLTDGHCEKADLTEHYDKAVLAFCGLAEHSTLPWREFTVRVAERILFQGKREKICGGCQWNAICAEKEALYHLSFLYRNKQEVIL